jgi:hypothetical protein
MSWWKRFFLSMVVKKGIHRCLNCHFLLVYRLFLMETDVYVSYIQVRAFLRVGLIAYLPLIVLHYL